MLRTLPDLSPEEWWEVVHDVLAGGSPVHPVPGPALPEDTPQLPTDEALLTGAAVVLATSGSTGTPKLVVLDAAALLSSARATHERLGGPGQWLQTLSPAHVAGWQVWVRSVLADAPPVVLPRNESFTSSGFVAAAARMQQGMRRYVALVPTQLHRLLDDARARAALRSFDAVLIGGAAMPAAQQVELDREGVSWLTTYGGTETSGGCLYAGRTLPAVTARVDPQSRMMLSGPVLARGYLGDPGLTRSSFVEHAGSRWFVTSDLAAQGPDGSWRILGRVDEVINTGGHKVHPGPVEEALSACPEIAQAVVVGVPDPQWGQRVAALLVLSPALDIARSAPLRRDATRWVRARLRDDIPAEALPRQVHLVQALPRLPAGKPDRAAAMRLMGSMGGTIEGFDHADT